MFKLFEGIDTNIFFDILHIKLLLIKNHESSWAGVAVKLVPTLIQIHAQYAKPEQNVRGT